MEAFQGETAPAPSTAALNGSSSHSEVVNGEAGSDAATENGASQSNGAGQRKSNMNGSYSMDGGSPDGPDGDLSQPMASNDNDAPASAVHTVERHLKEVQEVRWGPEWPLKAVYTHNAFSEFSTSAALSSTLVFPGGELGPSSFGLMLALEGSNRLLLCLLLLSYMQRIAGKFSAALKRAEDIIQALCGPCRCCLM